MKKGRKNREVLSASVNKVIRSRSKKVILAAFSLLVGISVFSILPASGLFASDLNTNELQIQSRVTYTNDFMSGKIKLDMGEVDTEKYEIKELLDPDMNLLPLDDPEFTVDSNGEYQFTLKYIDKAEVNEEKDIKVDEQNLNAGDKTDQETMENDRNETDILVDGQAITENETSVQETAETELQDKNETKYNVDDAENDFDIAKIDEKAEEILTIKVLVNEIKNDRVFLDKSHENTIEKESRTRLNSFHTLSASNGNTSSGTSNLGNVFDLDNWKTDGGQKVMSMTNLNASINNDEIIYYDAQPGWGENGVPQSTWNAIANCWDIQTILPSKEKVSLHQNWLFSGSLTMPVSSRASGESGVYFPTTEVAGESGIQIRDENGKTAYIAVGRTSTKSNQRYLYSKTSADAYGNKIDIDDSDANGGDCEIEYKYNKLTGTGNLVLKYNEHEKTLILSGFTENATLSIMGRVKYSFGNNSIEGQRSFPCFNKSSFIFDQFSYENYSPTLIDTKWYTSEGVEIKDDTNLKAGDVLTVKTSMKNDAINEENIDVMLKLSDDESQAKTKGVIPNDDIKNGIPVTLSNGITIVEFTVTVDDTVGDISLGVMMEDNFFHSKSYKQVESKISIGQVFLDGSPSYTFVEPMRNATTGQIITDMNGDIKFTNSSDQSVLNQDSYVKMVIDVTNPRERETMDMTLKADPANAAGLDFDHIYGKTGYGAGTISDAELIAFLKGTGELSFPLDAGATAEIEVTVPVKQTVNGAPADKATQKIDFNITGSFTHYSSGEKLTGTWEKESKIADSIADIDVKLNTTDITLQRQQGFDLKPTNNVSFAPVQSGSGSALTDISSVIFENQGNETDWKYFGIEGINDVKGKVAAYAEDGRSMKVNVTYNKYVMLNGKKHWTRLGSDANAKFRTHTDVITLTVNGGVVMPEAYIEIPNSLYLSDDKGIDDEHAGVKADIGLVDGLDTAHSFTLSADNNFNILNEKNDAYKVTLYDGNKLPYSSTSPDKVSIGMIDKDNRTKTVWCNIVKNPDRKASTYNGIMQFYVTMN